jgi:predicted permease
MKRHGFKRAFRFPFRGHDDVRNDIREEFEFHLDKRTEELVRSGLGEAAARAQARREFGDQQAGEERCAEVGYRLERKRRLARVTDELRQDVVFALRQIASHRSFAAVAIATLAIGMTANMTVFAIVNALVFKPLPVAAPQSLARIKAGQTQMAWASYDDIRRTNTVFSDLMAYRRLALGLTTGDRPVRVPGLQTSDNFFTGLGVPAALGRTYTATDSRHDLIVLSDRLWRVRFGADRSVVGRVLTLGGRPYEVAGIMSAGFRGVDPPVLAADFWIPVDTAAQSAILRDRAESAFEVVGRLRTGVTYTQAAAALSVLAQQIRAANPEIHESFVRVTALPVDGIRAFEGMVRTLLPVFAFIGVLTIVSGLVLLIGCANIAGLLAGRAATRRHEIALRLALGAGRGRLVRQLLTESLVLATVGGAVAVFLVSWFAGSMNTWLAALPIGESIDLRTDVRVLLYAAALTIVTTVVFGLAPARGAARFDVASSLKDAYGGSTGHRRFRRMLVAGQVTASAALLIWSGLFIRSLSGITNVNPGFDPAGVLLASIEFERGTEERGTDILKQLQQRVRQSANVKSAGLAKIVPLSMRGREEFDMTVVDTSGQANRRRVVVNTLTPGWFETVRIPLVTGRDFNWDDSREAPHVAIVNETLARQFWNGAAVDKQLFDHGQPVQVIGVVRDSKYWTIGETSAPTVYLPLLQRPSFGATLHVRTTDPKTAGALIVTELQRLAPDLAVDIEPMTEAVAVAVLPARVGAAATAAFGSLAMFLSALGVYGLVSFVVVQRRCEIGVRKALGAQMTDVVHAVVGDTARLTIIGLVCGVGVGLLGSLGLRGFIFGVSPFDAVTLAAASAVVVTAALLASAVPAIAAARVDPLIALRDA